MTLADLALTLNTDKESRHRYCSGLYEALLARFRGRPIRILEIGVWQGGSLELWRQWFPKAAILGIDPAPQCASIYGVTIMDANAYAPAIVARLPDFDIIIDDGPHTPESQLACLDLYLPKLREGGVLVIEDIQQPEFATVLLERAKHPDTVAEIVDLRPLSGQHDSQCLVVWKAETISVLT